VADLDMVSIAMTTTVTRIGVAVGGDTGRH
jgi:hypothetical protein